MQPPAFPGRLVLLGYPVAHSRSPAFQNAALRAAGIALHYEALAVAPDEVARVLRELRDVRGAGNATIPHKAALFAACHDVSAGAARAGAVNTFWHDADGRMYGENTDIAGFEAAVASLGTARQQATVALLGAGGAAAGVCVAVSGWSGATVRLVARNRDGAHALAARFPGVVNVADATATLDGVTLVVNATPVGMKGSDEPVDTALIPPDADVMDLVYRDGETPWVRAARARGLRAIDGREMLLHQGAAAFRCWFQRDPDLSIMRTALGQPVASA